MPAPIVFPFLDSSALIPLYRHDALDPLIPVSIGRPGAQEPLIAMWGLVDSGAGRTVLPTRLMAQLGIAQADCQQFPHLGTGSTDPQLAWRSPVKVPAAVGGYLIEIEPDFHDTSPFPVILGRRDFFASFDVEISGRDQRVTLRPHEGLPFVGVDGLTAQLERVGPSVCEVSDSFDFLHAA